MFRDFSAKQNIKKHRLFCNLINFLAMKNRTRQTGEWSVICTRPTLLTLAWASGRALMSNPVLVCNNCGWWTIANQNCAYCPDILWYQVSSLMWIHLWPNLDGLIMCTKGTHGRVPIDTLDRYTWSTISIDTSIDILIDSRLTLDRHLVNSQLIVGQVSTDWYASIWRTVEQDVDGVSMKCQLRCWWSVDWVLIKCRSRVSIEDID